MSEERHTPQLLQDPIVDSSDDEASFGWYYSPRSGGFVLTFGKYAGQKVHATSIAYLYWCQRTFDSHTGRNRPLLEALQEFFSGLESYAKTNYEDFIIPFGHKHRGKMIRECRDKRWLKWVSKWLSTAPVMMRKYGVFFTALEFFLANPRHQQVKRDIGELLKASEYLDDLELACEFERDYEFKPTESDLEGFVVPDDEKISVGSITESESAESSGSGEELSADNHSMQCRQRSSTDDDDGEGEGDGDYSSKSEEASTRSLLDIDDDWTTTKSKKRESRPASKDLGDFVVDDDGDDGSDEYRPSEGSAAGSYTRRTRISLRSNAKRKEKKALRKEDFDEFLSDSKENIQTPTRVLRSATKAKRRKERDPMSTPTNRTRKSSTKKDAARKLSYAMPDTPSKKSKPGTSGKGMGTAGQSSAAGSSTKQHTSNEQKESGQKLHPPILQLADMHKGSRSSSSDFDDTPLAKYQSPKKRARRNIVKSPSVSVEDIQGDPGSKVPYVSPGEPTSAAAELDVKGQARLINDYFGDQQVKRIPPDIRRALETVVTYIQQQGRSAGAPTGSNIQMDSS